jgi:Ca2+-binding RTX toxin-like protein
LFIDLTRTEIPMTLPTVQDVVNKYLYGSTNTPSNLEDSALIRATSVMPFPSIAVNTEDFMTTGAGRFAVGGQFTLVQDFFNTPASAFTSGGTFDSSGNHIYTKTQMAAFFALSSYGFATQQYDWRDDGLTGGTDDLAARTFIYGSSAFRINDNALFTITPSGTLSIQHFDVIPDLPGPTSAGVHENFDFTSSNPLTIALNLPLEATLDPSHLGKQVFLNFTAPLTSREATYDSTTFTVDTANISQWHVQGTTSPDLPNILTLQKLAIDGTSLLESLWTGGVTKFLTANDQPILYGTQGNDSLDSSQATGISFGPATAAGIDNLSKFAGNGVALIGGAGNDSLHGGAHSDTLIGGTGSDSETGGGGADLFVFRKGDGTDTITDFNESEGDKIGLTGGLTKADVTFSHSGTDLVVHDDDITVNNFFTGTSDTGPHLLTVQFDSGIVNFLLDGSANATDIAAITPAAGGGGGAGITLSGTSGNDTLNGSDGADDLIGGAGNDVLVGHGGGASGDFLEADDGNDIVWAGSGNAQIFGGTGNDTLHGGSGNDQIDGGTGSNVINAGDGNDVITFGSSGATGGENAVFGEGGDDTLHVGGGVADYLDGGDDNDLIRDDVGGTNTLIGGSGDDSIIAASGSDLIIDGEGQDYYQGTSTSTIIAAADFTTDTFAGGGVLDLSASTAGLTLSNYVSGNNLTSGELGNAVVTGFQTVIGGQGNDTFTCDSTLTTFNGGAGNDYFEATAHVAGGTGSDTFAANVLGSSSATVMDFSIGDEDLLLLKGLATAFSSNAADVSHLNGVQSGNDFLLDVLPPTGAEFTLLTLHNFFTQPSGLHTILVDFNDDAGGPFALNVGSTGALSLSSLDGASGADSLAGTTGDDTMFAFEGSDTLSGGAGNDILNGGVGADTMNGGTGDDTFVVDNVTDVIGENASEGTDLVLAATTYALPSNVENLTLTATAVTGVGNSQANAILGNDTDNTLDGGGGSDTLIGGLGNDTYIVNNTGVTVLENPGEGTDTLQTSLTFDLSSNAMYSNIENLWLTGASTLVGTGNSLDNVITANAGIDTLVGGLGDDTYVVSVSGTDIVENLAEGTDLVLASVTFSLASLSNVENITLIGSGNVNATGNSLNNTLTDNFGNDTLLGGGGDDVYVVNNSNTVIDESVSQGNDSVETSVSYALSTNVENLTLLGVDSINGIGSSDNNVITGNEGNNSLDGGAGADTMIGGTGDDNYIVDNTGDVVIENSGEGTDTVQSSINFSLALLPNVENLTLTGSGNINGTGNSGVNVIIGNTGDNSLDGGAGADTMIGGQGNDTYAVDNVGDVVTENSGEGTDLVLSSVAFTLSTNVENLTLTGSSSINGTGNNSDNVLNGNSGSNTLSGGSGNDTLWGGTAGSDTLTGGSGNDLYIVDRASGITIVEATGGGTDTVQSSVTYTLSSTQELENLTLTGSNNINGTGNALANVITGNSGNNILDGGTGADTLVGGQGNDTYFVDNAGDVITENSAEGTDTVSASLSYSISSFVNVENLIFTGTSVLVGTGNAGDNSITGNSAADTLIGGTGNDTYIITNTSTVITENVGEGTDAVQASANYSLASASNVENLTLTGSSVLSATGTSGDNVITGNSAADTLTGLGGNDTYVISNASTVIVEAAAGGTDTVQSSVTFTLSSTQELENLTLTGTANINGTGNTLANIITGNSGDNTLDGGTGADTMIGGLGNDTYFVDNVGDVVTENSGQGTDTISASVSYSISTLTNVENLILTGASVLSATGNSGDNILTANSAADTLTGGLGNDTYVISNASTVIVENSGEGTDTVQSSVTFSLATLTNIENLILTGTATINGTGNGLDNLLYGNSGNNTLTGGGGNDTIWGGGGGGTDRLVGGIGDDTYIVDATSGITVVENASEGTDTVQASVNYTLGTNLENLTLTGTALVGTGNTVANIITGNSADNTLNGSTGADTLIGGLGNDTYFVDNAGDVITENSSEGTDTVSASLSFSIASFSNVENLTLTGTSVFTATGNTLDNTLTGNSAADSLVGGQGNDTYVISNASTHIVENSGEGIDTVLSSVTFSIATLTDVENLTLALAASNSNGTGNALDNVIYGNTGSNILDGGAGNDTLWGGGSGNNDTLIGGTGDDTFVVDAGGASLGLIENVGEGTDIVLASVSYTLTANVENLTLTGTTALQAVGNALVNIITGNSADNTLDGSTGADTLIGGLGNDTYFIDNAGDAIIENSGEGTDLVESSSVSVSIAAMANVENITLTGSSNINATGNSLANVILGNTGSNTLDGGAGADTMTGNTGNDTFFVDNVGDVVNEGSGAGNDTVVVGFSYTLGTFVENIILVSGAGNINGTGNTLNNILTGNSDNNILDGISGTDTLIGGGGNDTFVVASTLDVVTAGTGRDTIQSSISWDMSATGHNNSDVENLTLTGSSALVGTGNGLDNTFTGNSGADTLVGGLGDDTYIISNASTVITESASAGADAVKFQAVASNVTFTLASNVENLTLTGSANSSGIGNGSDNSLIGNTNANSLNGGTGNDTLDGGDGLDTLTGGTGADIFVFHPATAFHNIDVVSDFNKTTDNDKLDIHDILIGYSGTVTDFVRISDSGSDSIIEVDRDGTGSTYGWQQIATLTGITGLTDEAALVTSGNLIVT